MKASEILPKLGKLMGSFAEWTSHAHTAASVLSAAVGKKVHQGEDDQVGPFKALLSRDDEQKLMRHILAALKRPEKQLLLQQWWSETFPEGTAGERYVAIKYGNRLRSDILAQGGEREIRSFIRWMVYIIETEGGEGLRIRLRGMSALPPADLAQRRQAQIDAVSAEVTAHNTALENEIERIDRTQRPRNRMNPIRWLRIFTE